MTLTRGGLLVALVLAPLLSACGGGAGIQASGSGGSSGTGGIHGGGGAAEGSAGHAGGAGNGGQGAVTGSGGSPAAGGYAGGAAAGGQGVVTGSGGAVGGAGGRVDDAAEGGIGGRLAATGGHGGGSGGTVASTGGHGGGQGVVTATGGTGPAAQLGAPCDVGVSVPDDHFFGVSPNAPGCAGLCVLPGMQKTTDTGAFCTGDCGSDADCAGGQLRNRSMVGDKRCATGFTCREMVPDLAGNPASCRSLCICKDFLADSSPAPAPLGCPAPAGSPPATTPAVAGQFAFRPSFVVQADVLFVVDDSASMAALQAKLAQAIPTFTNTLTAGADVVADLHVAVVSSSMGAGAWANVPSCMLGHPGNDRAAFQQGPGGPGSGSCPGLHAGETYLKTGDGSAQNPANFDGPIDATLGCMVQVGSSGCEFSSPFESAEYALYKADFPSVSESPNQGDPDNGGFLRANSVLAVIMFTDQDDCSVASNSLLFDPRHTTVADSMSMLGGFQPYRCSEFGLVCGGQPPPHQAPSTPVTLNSCVSAENNGLADTPLEIDPNGSPDPTNGHLTTVAELVTFMKDLKPRPDQIVAAAISGPPTPYVVGSFVNAAAANEVQPAVQHSCEQAGSSPLEYGDPAVRIKQWADAFNDNSVFAPICAASLQPALQSIATVVRRQMGGRCLTGLSDVSNCQATVTTGLPVDLLTGDTLLPRCDSSASVLPCWRAAPDKICPNEEPDFTFVPDPAADPALIGAVILWCPAG